MRPWVLFAVFFCAVFCAVGCAPGHGTIGAVLGQKNDGRLFIRETPGSLAAHEAGLRPGDEVLLIDGIDVRTLSPEAVHARLSGDVGTKVKLTVIRENEVIRATLERRTPPRRSPTQPPD